MMIASDIVGSVERWRHQQTLSLCTQYNIITKISSLQRELCSQSSKRGITTLPGGDRANLVVLFEKCLTGPGSNDRKILQIGREGLITELE